MVCDQGREPKQHHIGDPVIYVELVLIMALNKLSISKESLLCLFPDAFVFAYSMATNQP